MDPKCVCIIDGLNGTTAHTQFSGLVFSAEDFDGRLYIYPCENHVGLYVKARFEFECVIVGERGFRIMKTGNGWQEKWDVIGSKGDTWTVAKRKDGTFGCSCPYWKFHKAPKPNCKHIIALTTALNAGVKIQPKNSLDRLQSDSLEKLNKVAADRLKTEAELRMKKYVTGFEGFNIETVPGKAVPFKIESNEVQARVEEEIFTVRRKFRFDD